jgi:hypothetical protein
MPKENTNGVIVGDIAGTSFRAEVSWRGDRDGDGTGYVQLATTNENSPFKFEAGGDPDNPDGRFDGWHVTVDRDGCNRLIRSLRRARDAAYGADA